MITIKNDKGEICDYRIPYNDVNIKEEIEDIKKLIEECYEKFIETTGVPKDRLK